MLIDPATKIKNIELSDLANQVVGANLDLYKKNGFKKPWRAYLALDGSKVVGTCAFKSPPHNGRVEIAYFTFPENEGRKIATKMAAHLITIARNESPQIQIFAQTLPEVNASTRILEKLGFSKIKSVQHPEDGEVWEWELRNK